MPRWTVNLDQQFQINANSSTGNYGNGYGAGTDAGPTKVIDQPQGCKRRTPMADCKGAEIQQAKGPEDQPTDADEHCADEQRLPRGAQSKAARTQGVEYTQVVESGVTSPSSASSQVVEAV